MSARIPDWVLERHLHGELPEGFTQQDLDRDPSVAERLARLKAENAETLAAHPPKDVAKEVRWRFEQSQRSNQSRSSRAKSRDPEAFAGRRVMPWLSLAVAATLVAVVAPRVIDEDPEERPKGLAPHLQVFRKVGETTEALPANAPTFPGDVLQLRIIGAEARFATVVSIDGTGAVTRHAPAAEGQAVSLPQGGTLVLDRAYALDAAPRFERFVLVTSEQPFDSQVVTQAAEAVGADPERKLNLPEGLHQSSFVVQKEGVR